MTAHNICIDAARAIAKLDSLAQRVRAGVGETVQLGAARLFALVETKLSGVAPSARSGALRDSIRVETSETGARVFSDGSVPYARIQEYGGRIALPEIAPERTKALAFVYGGKTVFAKHAAAHAVTIPGRSYMRSSLAEFTPAFVENIRKVVAESVQ